MKSVRSSALTLEAGMWTETGAGESERPESLESAFEVQRHFVADAAHELRSPVTALQLQVQLLERSSEPTEQAAATAELASGITRMRRLIEQLLHLSHASADDGAAARSKRSHVSLGDIARSIVIRRSAQAETRQIDLGARVEAEVSVEADPFQLEVLLSNLVDNALRSTGRHGVVDVVCTRHAGAPAWRVIDNGPGMPTAERARVFDRFYRGPRTQGVDDAGSGLGMAIVKAIADRHGATVSLHDGPDGTGLEVRVVFQAAG